MAGSEDERVGEMNREETLNAIAVMQHYVDGAEIECNERRIGGVWIDIPEPQWRWHDTQYRVKVTKPSIDWSHVVPEYRWLAVNQHGEPLLYADKPVQEEDYWNNNSCGDIAEARAFTSFESGTCDWKDSLVQRPEGE